MRARPTEIAKDVRRRAANDWDNHVVLIDQALSPERQLAWFMRHLVQAIHYRSGLNDTCDEEAFTHSLATGITELSQQRLFWGEFNALLAQELQPRAQWGFVAAGCERPPVSAPKRIVCRALACTFKPLGAADVAANAVYAYYDANPTPRRIELHPTMRGPNFCLVVLHEVLHFIHEQWDLKTGAKERVFCRTQAMALLDFWRHNPKFWTWWLQQAATRDS